MQEQFFERPILNSPYEYPARHWELDQSGQPTQRFVESRRPASFLTPIPKPRKRKPKPDDLVQREMVFDEGKGLSSEQRQYEIAATINEIRRQVDQWRTIRDPGDGLVTPETARLLQHWRHHAFNQYHPFFCQVEAAETAIWLSEVAPKAGKAAKRLLEIVEAASAEANPDLARIALKLATGAGKTTVMAMLIAWRTTSRAIQSGKACSVFLVGANCKTKSSAIIDNPCAAHPLYGLLWEFRLG